ncbi:MAG: ABC transporter ATP-binding protein [Candidatus Omnitrophica bacterium]|nr:ABC transporter ATP-binding protein [Candidatus Omnitrophota bacterium]
MKISVRIYRKLIPFLKPHAGLFGWACLCMLAASLFNGVSLFMLVPLVDVVLLNRPIQLPPWFPAWAASGIQTFSRWPSMTKLHLVVGLALALFLLKNLAIFAQTVLMNEVALKFLRDIRDGLYRQYQRLSLDFFSGERTGELVSRITYDVSVLQNSLTEGLSDLVYQSSQVLFFVVTLVAINWRLALVVLVLLPAMGYPVVQIGKVLRKLGRIVQERMADLNSRLIETIQGIRIIKAFTAETAEAERFAKINQAYTKANFSTVKRQEALGGITELIGIVGGLFVLEVGARAVLHGSLSPGTFILFLGALLSLTQPVKKLSRIYSINQQAMTAAGRVVEILEHPPLVTDASGASPLSRFKREIRFDGVWFQYRDQDRVILQGVDLTIRSGEVVAIVGSSGCGKTTLVNLIPRFYDPVKGRVTIDGADLRAVTLDSLRRQVGLVTQDPFLFHDTVRANIAFGDPSASLDSVIRAAQAANADPFIRRLPAGYDTPVGELGARLSGGERQRIAIARALLKDPPILILDEATSQLDSESEALVQEALERLMNGRTVFLISHRLSTIRNVDRIIVLDQGRVAEVGRHEDLLQESPVYRRLYEFQVAT